MSRYGITGILDLIMPLPLGFHKVAIYSGYTEQNRQAYAVNQIKAEESDIMKDNAYKHRGKSSSS